MAVKLIANYAKRLGLPGYSSHQFSVSCETELTDLSAVSGEASRLYALLQGSVDREIAQVGFVPGEDYGKTVPAAAPAEGSHDPGHERPARPSVPGAGGRWACSDKQRELILQLVSENGLDLAVVEAIALDRFGTGLRLLNKLQASGLIGEVLELVNRPSRGGQRGAAEPARNGRPPGQAPAYRRGGTA